MGYLADAHTEWHTVHGALAVCPLDCGVTEGLYDEAAADDEWAAENAEALS